MPSPGLAGVPEGSTNAGGAGGGGSHYPAATGPVSGGSGGGGGGRLSSQQVQAKGKDLLHTAGVLGGRANVAAKGLFQKGKQKWRTSGNSSGAGSGGGGGTNNSSEQKN
jgi:hypothetical protein